ncbi:protein of unknown function [Halpernia humi]|uniref:DUF4270 domain-containing protein n=1 Tax=Halpernia humi TaxID=493375 RepID=A0A1H6AKV2_9FLAO|nr:DUF4270 family protein [Halpernia humi]SEG49328.1 protein of unknown function [Halpernia humi]
MTKKFQGLLQITFFALVGSLLLINCEPNADNLGSQFFTNGAAQDSVVLKDLIAYNISNNDTIRTDNAKMDSVTLGAFDVPQFGKLKSSYFTQVRLSSYAPTFGTNAKADSAVLVITPSLPTSTDSIRKSTINNFIYPTGNIASTKITKTYPVIYKYGRTKIGGKTKLTINVNEVTDYMGSTVTKLYSNQDFATGALLGSKDFYGDVTSVNIKSNADSTELFNREANLRIPLDSTFFQNKIIAKAGMPELSDVSTFIRYFRGLKVSVAENDGYLFKFAPNQVKLQLYYKSDSIVDGVNTRPQNVFSLDVGSNNVHFQKIDFDRNGTAAGAAMAVSDSINGSPKLFLQGMGGPGVGLKIPATTIASLKDLYNNQKAGILSATIRLYSDNSWLNNFGKPKYFVTKQKNVSTFLKEFTTYSINPNFRLITTNNLYGNPSYYDINITKTVKDVIETEAPNKDIVINVGDYTLDAATQSFLGLASSNLAYGQNFNTRSYTPNAVVLVGTDSLNPQRAQLRVIYAKKQ